MKLPDGPELVSLQSHVMCNYHCRFCAHGNDPDRRPPWPMEIITQQCEPLWQHCEKVNGLVNLGSTGEIGLWPHIYDALEYFTSRNIRSCFTTNGRYLDPSRLRNKNLDHIMVSLHTVDESIYDDLTGTHGNLPKVLENIKQLAAQPRKHQIHITVVLTEKNVRQVPDVARFCKEIGVDVLRLAPLFEPASVGMEKYEDGLIMQETPENLAAIKEAHSVTHTELSCLTPLTNDRRRRIVAKRMRRCNAPYNQACINYEGDVLPCCFLGWADLVMGNLFSQSWHDIWNGKKYQRFRNDLKRSSNSGCLKYCKNWG